MEYYQQDIQSSLRNLKTTKEGLTQQQITQRKKKYGENKLPEKNTINILKLFLSQFKSILIIILLIAIIISYSLGETLEGTVILIIVALNSIIGFLQEYKAEKTLQNLKKLTGTYCVVVRDGKKTKINTKSLVPGDILLLEEGTRVPADARIIQSINLQTNESSLTGESVPLDKGENKIDKKSEVTGQKNMVFSGTIITKGRGKAVVTQIGTKTEIGKIATLIDDSKKEATPLQKRLNLFAKKLGIITLLLVLSIFVIMILQQEPLFETFKTIISLAVAIIPEGLPAVLILTLAISVQRMAKKRAIIRKLSSAETLGSVTVICTDKTGTLTCNQMTVKKLYCNNEYVDVTGEGYNIKGSFSKNLTDEALLMLRTGMLCNNAEINKTLIGDPTELALITSAEKAGIKCNMTRMTFPKIKENPFTSERKLMSTINKTGKNTTMYVKGAPDNILSKCTNIHINGKIRKITKQDKKNIINANRDMAKQSLRILGFAYKTITKNQDNTKETHLTFIGLQGMIDPPRPEIKKSIENCKQAGIKIIMITGDHTETAKSIGKQIGITGKIMTGKQLQKIEDLENKVEEIAIYARVTPEQKNKIVEALRKKEHIIAMTGDGVNDAPAMKKADIGVSMGTGTDVAKEASSIILQDDNFSTMVTSIEEGRTIYKNIKKFIYFLLSSNITEVLTIFFAIIIGLKTPLIAIHILWINLLTDGLPAIALGLEKKDKDVMKEKPIKKTTILDKIMTKRIVMNVTIMTIITLLFFILSPGIPPETTQSQKYIYSTTIAFTTLVILELFNAINSKSQTKYFWQNFFSNKILLLAILTSFFLQLVVLYLFNEAFKVAQLPLQIIFLIVASSSVILLIDTAFKKINKIKEIQMQTARK